MNLDNKPPIEFCDLSIGFSNEQKQVLPILRLIDLTVIAGDTVGLVVECGSGKCTLALVMMCYLGNPLNVLIGSTSFRHLSTFVLLVRFLQ